MIRKAGGQGSPNRRNLTESSMPPIRSFPSEDSFVLPTGSRCLVDREWTCNLCTYTNADSRVDTCSVCGTTRDVSVSRSQEDFPLPACESLSSINSRDRGRYRKAPSSPFEFSGSKSETQGKANERLAKVSIQYGDSSSEMHLPLPLVSNGTSQKGSSVLTGETSTAMSTSSLASSDAWSSLDFSLSVVNTASDIGFIRPQLTRIDQAFTSARGKNNSSERSKKSGKERKKNAHERSDAGKERSSIVKERNAIERSRKARERSSKPKETSCCARERGSDAKPGSCNATERSLNAIERSRNAIERSRNARQRNVNSGDQFSNTKEDRSNPREQRSTTTEESSSAREQCSSASEQCSSVREQRSNASERIGTTMERSSTTMDKRINASEQSSTTMVHDAREQRSTTMEHDAREQSSTTMERSSTSMEESSTTMERGYEQNDEYEHHRLSNTSRTLSFAAWSMEDDVAWICSLCTFVNEDPMHLTCAACGSNRDSGRSASDKEDPLATRHIQLQHSDVGDNALSAIERERLDELVLAQFELLTDINVKCELETVNCVQEVDSRPQANEFRPERPQGDFSPMSAEWLDAQQHMLNEWRSQRDVELLDRMQR